MISQSYPQAGGQNAPVPAFPPLLAALPTAPAPCRGRIRPRKAHFGGTTQAGWAPEIPGAPLCTLFSHPCARPRQPGVSTGCLGACHTVIHRFCEKTHRSSALFLHKLPASVQTKKVAGTMPIAQIPIIKGPSCLQVQLPTELSTVFVNNSQGNAVTMPESSVTVAGRRSLFYFSTPGPVFNRRYDHRNAQLLTPGDAKRPTQRLQKRSVARTHHPGCPAGRIRPIIAPRPAPQYISAKTFA